MPAASQPSRPVTVFYSYSSKDEELRDQLAAQLSMLKRERVIQDWHDRRITPGCEWNGEISEQLKSADIILLLVSPDFLASDYCYDPEVTYAMERHKAGKAHVIPVILRPTDWRHTPFGKLQALPKDANPVSRWSDRDAAFLDISEGIRQVVEEIYSEKQPVPSTYSSTWHSAIPRPPVIGFVARRDADGRDIVAHLSEQLAPGQNRLVTLSGPGGVGKTTLAAETARELTNAFDRRVVWSSAEGRGDFGLSTLLDDISTQLGREDLRPLSLEEKAAQVQALVADPPALVVLDNYETIKPDAKSIIEEWLTHAPCSALVTSRQRISMTLSVAVAAMSSEEAQDFLEKVISQTQDAQIFSADVRQRIYKTAEANPFVMQWVVGQIDAAQEPQTALEELQHGEGDAAARVFDRSFNLPQLGDDGRATLLALSLFAPNATREALAEVAGLSKDSPHINEALKNLRALWLIKAIDWNRRFAVEGLTRSLAAVRLSKDPRAAEFRQRFVTYFLNYAEAHQQVTPEDLTALEAEKDNLLNAAEAAYAFQDWQSVVRMAYLLAADGMLVVRGYWDDAVRLSEKALQTARLSKNEALLAGLSHNLAVMYQNRGQLENARRFYDESLEAAKMLGNRSSIASTLHNLAAVAQDSGDFEEARNLYRESLSIKKEVDDQSGIAATMHQLGLLAQTQGDLDEAQRFYNESLEINKRLNDQSGIATTLHNLGIIAQRKGALEEARRLYNESLKMDKRLGNQYGIAVTLHNLGMLAQKEGTLDEARRLYDESLEIKQKLGDQLGMAATFRNLATIAQQSGDIEEAQRLLGESIALEEKARKYISTGEYWRGAEVVETSQLESDHKRAIDLMRAGLWREARDILQTNRERYKTINDKRGFAETLLALAQSEHAIGDLEKARWTYKDALDLFTNLDERLAAVTSGYLARLELQTGLVKDALTHLREAEDYFERAGNAENLEIIRQLIEAAEEIAAQQTDYETKTSVFMNKRRPRK